MGFIPGQETQSVVRLEQIVREVESDFQRQRLLAQPASGGVITLAPCYEPKPGEQPRLGRGVACGAGAVQPAEPEPPRAVVLAPVVDALADDALADGKQTLERWSGGLRSGCAARLRAGGDREDRGQGTTGIGHGASVRRLTRLVAVAPSGNRASTYQK